MNYQCSNEFILALRDIAQICEKNNTDNLRLLFDISDNRELCVYISFEVKENNSDKKPTNSDRIRSMSDEELAEFIEQISAESMDTISFGTKDYEEIWEHKETSLKWLQSEVEE